jgi:hypothetical protein
MFREWVGSEGFVTRFRSKSRGKFFNVVPDRDKARLVRAIRKSSCKKVFSKSCTTTKTQSITMVKKRNRDPEVPAEAPRVDDEGSGSDTVGTYSASVRPAF